MKRALAAVVLAAWSLTASAQAYRCTVDGAVRYQQQPCEGGVALDVPPPAAAGSWEARVASAIARRRVLIGMTDDEVRRAWGRPDRINVTVAGETRREQWVYRRASVAESQYLYLTNGVLRSAQSPDTEP